MEGKPLPDRTIDNAAAAVAVASIGWVPALQTVNVVLTTVSLVAGLIFLAWRWKRQIQSGKGE